MRIFVIGHTSPDLDAIAAAVEYSEFLEKIKRYKDAEIIPVRAGEPNLETQSVFEKFGADMPKSLDEYEIGDGDSFVLVDHNEESQRHEKIVSERVLEIIDHHKINITLSNPVRIDVKPVGSTSTVIFEHFEEKGIEASKPVLGLMLGGILSDTVGLKSSTTTGLDIDAAEKISKDLGQNIEKFTFEIFKAKSDISGLSVDQIARKDFKVFDFGGTKFFINQVETVEPGKILEMKEEIIAALERAKSEEGASLGVVVVTDILAIDSKVIYSNEVEKGIVEQAFTTQGKDGIAEIGPKMSRKKDIAPAIEKIVTEK